MRNNQPVNDRETLLPPGEFIYSRTDLKGIITEANEAFARISAYQREEMLGQPHNMVRHPDMPVEAFADLWRDLKAGRPWRGVVKNRRKDGGFYWVVANVSPVREKGRVVGYQSVRSSPSREEVAAADAAYRRLRAGDRSIAVKHGRIVPARLTPWVLFSDCTVQLGAIGILCALLAAALLIQSFYPGLGLEAVWRVLGGIGLVWGAGFLLFCRSRLLADLSAITAFQEELLITGDLTRHFDLERRDRVGDIARGLDTFVSSIQATVQGMGDSASQVLEAAREVEVAVHNVSHSAKVQSDATASAAAGIEEITVSIGEVAQHAAATRDAARSASQVAVQGQQLSAQASTTIQALAETVKGAAGQVELLGRQSDEISRITGVIRGIADQTNLLALNANIEAARAGEAGRGFAVVADEVRKLAERTSEATREIAGMVSSIQEETQKAVDGMRSGAQQVEEGVQLVHEAQQALEEINAQMGSTLHMVHDISHSSAQQQEAMTAMACSVEQVASMTDQNVAVVTQTGAAVDRLHQTVERMQKAVGQYSI